MSVKADTLLQIDEDTFIETYRPLPNHLDLSASFDFGDGGCLFSSAGKEFRHVLAQDPRRVWTLLEGDNGGLFIGSGLHLVNRLGYIITAEPMQEDADAVVGLQ